MLNAWKKSWRDANAKESHLRARLPGHTVKEVKLELLHPATKISLQFTVLFGRSPHIPHTYDPTSPPLQLAVKTVLPQKHF